MNKKDKSFIPIEAFSIPEDTIFLDSESLYEPIKLAIKIFYKPFSAYRFVFNPLSYIFFIYLNSHTKNNYQ